MKSKTSFLIATVVTLSACLEQKMPGDGSGQIVVVGNGSDWSQTLVVDVEQSAQIVSYVLEGERGFKPVMSQLSQEDISARLDWVAPNPQTGGALIQVEVPTDQSKVVFAQEASASKVERQQDLETFTFSEKIAPQNLSNGGILFVNAQGELRYSGDRRSSRLIKQNIESWTSDLAGNLYVEEAKNLWKVLRFEDVAARATDFSPEEWAQIPSFKADLFFVTALGKPLILILTAGAGLSADLVGPKLYVFKADTKTFAPIGTFQFPALRVASIDSASGVRRGDSWIGSIELKTFGLSQWVGVDLSELELRVLPLPLSQQMMPYKFAVLGDGLFARSSATEALYECHREGPERIWRCLHEVRLGKIKDFAVGPRQELIVAHDHDLASGFAVSRFGWSKNQSITALGAESFSGEFESLRAFRSELISEHRESGHVGIKDFKTTK